jgi:excisionase family DNA binding protein
MSTPTINHPPASDRPNSGAATTERVAFSVPEVAAMLGVSRASAYTYVRTGVIRSITLGGRIIIPRKATDELLELEASS